MVASFGYLNSFNMKKLFFIWMLVVGFSAANAQMQSAKLQASGLTCAMCAKSIYKNLTSLPFVENVDTDLEGSAFLITFKKSVPLSIDDLRKKVEDAGFAVAGLEITANVSNLSLQKDSHINLDGNAIHVVQANAQEKSGALTFKIVDRAYLGPKEQKKFAKLSNMDCFKTGLIGACCKSMGLPEKTRIYHVII